MDHSTAETVVATLQALAPAGIALSIEGGRVCFSGATGCHSIDVTVSTVARVYAHFDGFVLSAAPSEHAAVMARVRPMISATAPKGKRIGRRPLINATRYTELEGDECVQCSTYVEAGSTAWTSDVHSGCFCTRDCLYYMVRLARESEV